MILKNNEMPLDCRAIPIEELIMHRAPMLLVSKLLDYSSTSAEVLVNTADSSMFFDASGKVPAWVGIEYMAQAIATYAGLVGRQQGQAPRLGFLLGTRKYSATVSHFAANQTLRVLVEEAMRDPSNLVLFRCKIFSTAEDEKNIELASAEIKAIQPDDIEAALAMFEKS